MNFKIFLTILLSCITLTAQQDNFLLYENGDFKIFTNKASYQDKTLYDVINDYRRLTNADRFETLKCTEGIKVAYNPLSLVADYYSYESNLFDTGADGDCYRNPSSEAAVNTIDVVTGEKISLLDLVEEFSLVNALKNDPWVRDMYGTMNTAELDSKSTFKEILALINSNMGFGIKFQPDSFALLSYDRSTKLVAARLIGIKYLGYDHSRHIQLGLYLEPKGEILEELEKEKGFFLGKFKNGLL